MIHSLRHDAPIQQLCQIFDFPRSTYYYQAVDRDETDMLTAIEQVLMRRPWFGYATGMVVTIGGSWLNSSAKALRLAKRSCGAYFGTCNTAAQLGRYLSKPPTVTIHTHTTPT